MQTPAPPHLGGYIHGSDANTWYPALWTWLQQEFQIRSLLDVGCGEGYTAKFWQSLGCDVLGIEGSESAILDSAIPDAVQRHDFTVGPFRPPRAFDAVWCCEVVEHIEAAYVPHVLDTLTVGRVLVMTHGVPGQPGTHHVNCQPSRYWVRHLAARGFHLRYRLSRHGRTLAHSYFRKTGMVFTRERSWLPSTVALSLLTLEWFPRRVWSHIAKGSAWSTLRRQFMQHQR